MKIRSNLRPIAELHGHGIREIARAIEYRFESVRQMYNDEMERYPRELLAKLCEFYGVTPSELLTLEPEDQT